MPQDSSDRSTAPASETTSTVNGYPAKAEPAASSARSLYDVCLEIRNKVDSFLAEDPSTTLLRNVQARVREAIGVVDEAFQRYEYASNPSPRLQPSPSLCNLLIMPRIGPRRYPYHITAGKTVCEDICALFWDPIA
ncbi:hypothetical protein ONZ43_g4685 [Nemania bipapillata]|uniref:Uncharacterized protein n=1 Tax=Nemania bipapillata TaxID=110536 RepID=A0ACC2IJR6_9PEZI|nr:hypothetical protein ONZ43_g4685 [Nemania bipapillata]